MNPYRTFPLTAILFILLFGLRTQAQKGTVPIEKDIILQEFESRLSQQDSIDILAFFKPYVSDSIEIRTQEAKYKGMDSSFRYKQFRIKEDLLKQLDSIQKAKRHPVVVEEPPKTPSIWIRILKILAWIVGLTVLLSALLILFPSFKNKVKSKVKSRKVITNLPTPNEGNSDIVVRRKTTSILRKQSLENVIDNDNYMKIECSDFYADSAVKRMYIKNTCIKDIYNMYAEDLRNPDRPKEDGCMVLGRWVYDKEGDEYYVSLEHIVLPGDDAIFAEYELNFGGKIKLKVKDKLRKLRIETDLQYDLTCWVHSHPGLGVFFSNSDCNVQTQLKHPIHPRFLTAIVIDILTPNQELGIFTFKHNGEDDAAINSKAELKKLYSLEEWYKWAVESERNSFRPEDHYDTLFNAKAHIELSNGAIIDMGLLAAEQSEGFVGTVHGFVSSKSGKMEYVVGKVSEADNVPDNDLIGCFFITSHCSIPSIRKALANRLNKIKFILVYTTGDGLLTSIPVINNDLCNDQIFYGEQQLEELKIWTRRKR